ncbi:MAG: outer membrane beta-barrel protein [Woeseiaceae bacterium]|nr:outer membrane beta-barrel protein [Woeseiaceae bacterium]
MKKLIPLFALTAFSAPALAADTDGFYGSVGGGLYRLESGAFDNVSPSTKILGGYAFNDKLALESSYTRLFKSSELIEGARVDIDGNVWDLSTKLSYPLSNRFSPFMRLGYSYVDLSALITESGVSERFNDYDNAYTWAVGSAINLNRRFNVSGEFARTMINEGDLDFLTIRLNYGFGAQ